MNNFSQSTKELSNIINNFYVDKCYKFKSEINNIGLTGASGFLGLHIISHLINNSNILKIKCFIRSKDTFNQRKKLFGLNFSEDKLEFLFEFNNDNTKDLDLFIHSAAQVNNIKKLSNLFLDNVELTQKVIKNVSCPIVYISTLSVYASSNIKGNHYPTYCDVSENHYIYGGYAQSKWLGEYLMLQRKDTKIIRLGLLTPSTQFPILQENEFFSLFLKLSKDFPYYPIGFEESFIDISPIDLVTEQIIKNLSNNQKYTHIANHKGTSINTFIDSLKLTQIPQDEWESYINNLKKIEKILLSFAYFKNKSLKQFEPYFNIDLFQTTGHNWNGSIYMDNINQYLYNLYEKI